MVVVVVASRERRWVGRTRGRGRGRSGPARHRRAAASVALGGGRGVSLLVPLWYPEPGAQGLAGPVQAQAGRLVGEPLEFACFRRLVSLSLSLFDMHKLGVLTGFDPARKTD